MRTAFENVTNARAAAMSATGAAKAGAENQLSGTLKSLFAVAENYPDLKANQNFFSFRIADRHGRQDPGRTPLL